MTGCWEGWVPGCIWAISGWHCAARVFSGKWGSNPQIYVKSWTRSLAQAARAVTPLRDFRRNGTVCACSSLPTTSEYMLLATWNNWTRHDITVSVGMKSVSAVTSSSVGSNPSCANTAAISPSISCNTGHSRGVSRLWYILLDDSLEKSICRFISFNNTGNSEFGNSISEQYS